MLGDAEIPLGLLASLTGALAFGFSFGSRQVVENAATVALNLRDDVYEVGDIIGFTGDDDFYRVADIKTSTVKNHNLELATPDTGDDTDMVEVTQAIAQSLRESFTKVPDLNGNQHVNV